MQTFAETLSHWVAWTDAISLSRVLADGRNAPVPGGRSRGAAGSPAVFALVRRVRKELTESIARDPTLLGETLMRVQVGTGVPAGDRVDHAAYRRNYRAHQHTMEDRIAELRQQVRAAVSQLAPALGHLAALDAVFDEALSAHQRRLLENVPLLLQKRFQALHTLLPMAPAQGVDPDTPVPRGLPTDMGQTWQAVLLAELEIRLQPVQAMLDAVGTQSMEHA